MLASVCHIDGRARASVRNTGPCQFAISPLDFHFKSATSEYAGNVAFGPLRRQRWQ
jgi:hypothetical protein